VTGKITLFFFLHFFSFFVQFNFLSVLFLNLDCS